MKKIQLNKECRLIAELFADLRCEEASIYSKRGGFKREDIVAGALGEIAAYLYLKGKGYETQNPDFQIHKKKTYNADLVSEPLRFHVKSQTGSSQKLYGRSWIFQRTDPLLKNLDPLDIVILTNVDLDTDCVEVVGALPVPKIKFSECKNPWFRKTKLAIYYTELRKSNKTLMQLKRSSK